MIFMNRVAFAILLLLTGILSTQPATAQTEEPSEADLTQAFQGDFQAMVPNLKLFSSFVPCQKLSAANESNSPQDQKHDRLFGAVFRICALSATLEKVKFSIKKIGCVKAREELGYNCDYILELNEEAEEMMSILNFRLALPSKQAFSSRFIKFQSAWYLIHSTTPFELNAHK